jgi:hypothetical protein
MSPKISVLIRKNSYEVISNQLIIITRSVQSDRRYCQYNNEGSDEIILPPFPTYLCYCELHEEVARKLSGFKKHSRTLHHTQTQ